MSEQLEPIIADDVVWGKAYYEMHEVDAIIAQKNKEIAELKATPHTDNSAVIDKMATEIAKLKEAQRWRKFIEEKPEKDQWCLVYHEGEIDADHYTDHCNNHCRFVMYGNYVTHWMPLPKEPEAI
jgi:hypothetical protein